MCSGCLHMVYEIAHMVEDYHSHKTAVLIFIIRLSDSKYKLYAIL